MAGPISLLGFWPGPSNIGLLWPGLPTYYGSLSIFMGFTGLNRYVYCAYVNRPTNINGPATGF
jgi:hypothetical protein